ncbi:MAG: undecaprenyl-phosphate glucose phosphotransferase [Spirochaetales bacterium]|nr:undecaprenyl-phosphate glucose phosphotransferase [Spirochaetales bacterium]
MRKDDQSNSFGLLQRVCDLLAVASAWFIAWVIRFYILPGGDPSTFMQFVRVSPILLLINLITFTRNNLYHTSRYYSWYREVTATIKAVAEGFAIFFVILYFMSILRMSRITFALYGVIVIMTAVVTRLLVRRALMALRSKGQNMRNVLLIGHGPRIESYARTLSYIPQAGIKITGWVDSGGLAEKFGVAAHAQETLKHVDDGEWDAAIVGYPSGEFAKITPVLNELNQSHIKTVMIPDLQYDFLGYRIQEFEGIPLIEINEPGLSLFQRTIKRTFDIIGSMVGLVLLSPVFVLVALLVKLTSRGPVFYGQERMSIDGKLFTMWKFRSMKLDAESGSGAQWATKDDNRKTLIGGLLRKTSLDEIPQFWNVLKGEMSIVGPRPERPVFIEQFKGQIPAYMLRHRMKAGVTGWAQVNGWRGNTSLEKRIEFDLYYIKHWSLGFDVLIILLTFVKGFVNPNAY